MTSLFTRLQVRYRSDRFRSVGQRFGAIEYNPQERLEIEMARMHRSDATRRRILKRALESAISIKE